MAFRIPTESEEDFEAMIQAEQEQYERYLEWEDEHMGEDDHVEEISIHRI